MTYLTLAELNTVCRRAANLPHVWPYSSAEVDQILDPSLIDFYYNLYNTGLRVNELQDASRWEITPAGDYLCSVQKGGVDRLFTSSELSTFFTSSLAYGLDVYRACRYSTASRYLNKVIWPLSLFVNDKSITTHLFRHNKIKQLANSGLTVPQIATYIGERDPQNIQGYLNAKVYF